MSDLYGSKYSKQQCEGQNCGAYGVLHNFTFVLFLGHLGLSRFNLKKQQVCLIRMDHNIPKI